MTDAQVIIEKALEEGIITQTQIDALTQNYLTGHNRLEQDERDAIVIWAIRAAEDFLLLHTVLEGRLLIGIRNGRIAFGNPEDVSQ